MELGFNSRKYFDKLPLRVWIRFDSIPAVMFKSFWDIIDQPELQIIKKGKDPKLVNYIERLYTRSEFKRAQLVQTIKINKTAFGMGRKIPILKKPTY